MTLTRRSAEWFTVGALALLVVVSDPARSEPLMRSLAPVLKEVTPAVVNISVAATRRGRRNPMFDDPFFRRFFNIPEQGLPQQRRSQSVGSGVIIDPRHGHVVTNHHVIDGADEVTVTLQDRRQFSASVIGSDRATDIALLKIDGEGLVAVRLGDSEALEVGDFVSAIGNPFGLGQTVTSGIVSALGRSGLIPDGFEDFIQTDASINPGNSGGALIDSEGNLVGINTAIISPAGGNVGIGFAVPVSMVKGVVSQLLDHGEVRRGRLGVTIQDVTPDLAEALELELAEGALVTQVGEGSSAAAAGIEVGDVIIRLNGRGIVDGSDLRNRIGLMRIGDSLAVEVVRDEKTLQLRAEVGEVEVAQVAGSDASPKLAGAVLRNIEPSHPHHGRVRGVEVAQVEPNSRAWLTGLRDGDIVTAVNRVPVMSPGQLADLVERSRVIALNILRGESRLFLVVR